jgi:type IV fimbrial biogenesis protein FimT
MRRSRHASRQRGVTLIGLLITTGIIGVLVNVALPALQSTVDGVRVRHTAMTLYRSLDQARMMAISHGRPILVSSLDGDWRNGWQVIVDADGNGLPGPDEPLIQTVRLPHGRVGIARNAGIGERVFYQPDGRAQRPGGGLQMGRFGVSRPDREPAFELILNAAGRVRLTNPKPD